MPGPRSIVIDTDPGVDDVLAILLALASPEVRVRLISIVFGNTHAPVAHSNLLKIYHLLSREIAMVPEAKERYRGLQPYEDGKKTVLALGGDDPVGGEKAVAAYFHGRDGLSNISETHPHFNPPKSGTEEHEHLTLDSRPSYEVMLEMLEKEEDKSIVVVALGPLTNIAHAIRRSPETFKRVGGVVWMGGTLEHPGNTSPVAEFNCFADPYAAAEVLNAAKTGMFELVMAPLDITTPHQVPFKNLIHPSIVREAARREKEAETASAAENEDERSHQLEQIQEQALGTKDKSDTDLDIGETPPTPLQAFIGAMLLRVRGLQASFGLPDAMEMHDPVAVWYAIAHAHLPGLGLSASASGSARPVATGADQWKVQARAFEVERNGELTRGMCVVDRRGTGETGVDRSKDDALINDEFQHKADKKEENKSALPKKDESKGRMGEDLPKSSDLPWVITHTPGSDVLRNTLLDRIFGESRF